MKLFSIAALSLLGLFGCASSGVWREVPRRDDAREEFDRRVEVIIPLGSESPGLKADIYRPLKAINPKSVIVIAPGAGNASRRGETLGDGVDTYKKPIDVSHLWAQALAKAGFFVLSYDKRTCHSRVDPACNDNDRSDIDHRGIAALASDLDRVLSFVGQELGASARARVVVLTSTQGAQVVAKAKSLSGVSGAVLLSPIVSDIRELWIDGLSRAAENAQGVRKNRLLNRRESMTAFFNSLEQGRFNHDAVVRGASVSFWSSWIEESKGTVAGLIESKTPVLLMFSQKDAFSSPQLIDAVKAEARGAPLSIEVLSKADRNFLADGELSRAAVERVMGFVAGLAR